MSILNDSPDLTVTIYDPAQSIYGHLHKSNVLQQD